MAPPPPPNAFPVPVEPEDLPAPFTELPGRLSRGLEAARWLGRRAARWVAGTAGCFGVVPFPLDRDEGTWRVLLDTAEAMGSFTGGEAFPGCGRL